MNEGDLGNAAADLFLANAKAEHERRQSRFYYTGLCWNCSEALSEGAFCEGGECEEDYKKRERMKA